MITLALDFAIACYGVALLMNLTRSLRGPTVADRLLAVDTMVVNLIALLVLAGIHFGTGINFEAALLLAMTGFVSTVAFCKYLLRGNIIE
ncbi:MAG: K+/H+ antiporter subunit F [Pseudorhodobacter sp.]|nr:K+/H+ antiporter subunit F [Pseudorhodobacter sp.]